MSTGEAWTLGRRPALDGLRGIACALVVVAHATIPGTFAFATAGTIGVTAFFTLSGFLITALLLEEHQRHGRVSLSGFYLRRARRLLPALFVYVAVVAALSLAFELATPRDVVASLLYVGNWIPASGGDMGALNHTWSLAVEEQFYIIWPLVLIVVLRRRSPLVLGGVAVVGALASFVARVALWDDGAGWSRIYSGSDTRADALLIGCVAAVLLQRSREGRTFPVVPSLVVPLCVVLGFTGESADKYVTLPAVTAALTALLIVAVARGPYSGWLTARWLAWVGRRSYGLYLWHFPFTLFLAPALPLPWLVSALAAVALSLLATVASWRFVEEPFLRRKSANPERPVARLDRAPLHDPLPARQP